jgi:glutamate-ammonia-ligase adenylyltransferase
VLGDDAALRRHEGHDLLGRARTALGWRTDTRDQQAGLRRFARDEEFRIAARDILGIDDVATTGSSLAALAETVLESGLTVVTPPVPMAVIGMGRLGGRELSYASDLDVLLVFGDEAARGAEAAEHAAEAFLGLINGATPAERIFRLDVDLRPEGKRGPLGRTLASYRAYYERWGQTWERQALVRARPVAGDADLGRRFMDLVEEQVWTRPFNEEQAREVRRIKARVERERIPAGEDPQFHLKLGRGSLSDVEWTVQLLQLQHRVRGPGTMGALEELAEAGALSRDDAQVLAQAYRFCERTRDRLYLVRGGPGDSLPTQAEQLARLARSLDTTPVALRDTYRRVTRRARDVVERLFYGRA